MQKDVCCTALKSVSFLLVRFICLQVLIGQWKVQPLTIGQLFYKSSKCFNFESDSMRTCLQFSIDRAEAQSQRASAGRTGDKPVNAAYRIRVEVHGVAEHG